MLSSLKSMIGRRARALVSVPVERQLDALLLQGRMASWQLRSLRQVASLQDVEFKVFSQFGEGGIIEWLLQWLAIPVESQTFIEFGVEDYREANTRFLLENRNWRGLIMDGNPTLLETLKRGSVLWRHDLTPKSAFITRENINDLLTAAGFCGEVGLLSIDVDGNDFWIWEAITAIQPIICICEYNAVFGDTHAISIPYDPAFTCSGAHFSRLYFGASIKAFHSLAEQKGYRFLGTNSVGSNAFFVREDYASTFDGALANRSAMPSRFRTSRDQAGDLTYVSGSRRFEAIRHLPVVLVETGETVKLSDLGPVYSSDWLR